MGVVAELPTQAAQVTCQRVGPEVGLGPPERVGNVTIADDRTSPRGEGVEEHVLGRRETDRAHPFSNARVQGVDLKIAHSQGSHPGGRVNSVANQRNQFGEWGFPPHDGPVIAGQRPGKMTVSS